MKCCSCLAVSRRSPAFPSSTTTQRRAVATASGREDCQERDFDRERFVNIAIQVIVQLFETADALQGFGCAESACQRSGFLFYTRQATLRHAITGAQNIGPPGEQCFDQSSAPLQVKTFGTGFVVLFAFFQPHTISGILVTYLFLLQCFICFALNVFPNRAKQTLKFLSQSIGKLNGPAFFAGLLLQ